MWQRIRVSVILAVLILVLSACGSSTGADGEYPHGHYEDEKMIGTVWEIDKNENKLVVDISEWEKRNRKGSAITDEGYSYTADLSKETLVKYEDGTTASIIDIKKGQKVLVNPPRETDFEGRPDEIVLLEMSYDEKYSQLLSHVDGFKIAVIYEGGKELPAEMRDSLYEDVLNLLKGTKHSAVAAWVEYDKDYVVDYQEELGIEQFPVMLVFDQDQLLFKAYEKDELYAFFRNLKE